MKIRNSPTFHGGGGFSGLRARKLSFKKVVKQVMRDQSYNQFMIRMENMMRRIVGEETHRVLQTFYSSSRVSMERSHSETPSSRPRLKLRFINSPPSSIFTGSKIEAEGGSPLMIELVDATTNTRVSSGPFSSSRVQLVPLNADFTEESWTVEEFKRNILKQREGKRPLLTGDLTLMLKNGVGVIAGDIAFSDNSSWTRSRKFRLGAKLTGDGAVEARSEAFGCLDQRGESYRKHHPPYPNDEVWRLEKIAKDGVSAKRLAKQKIKTVKEFRRVYTVDPNALHNIIGEGISKKTWKTIVSHAMDCVLDETECYIYNANTQGVTLLFNSVYELIKVSFNGVDIQNLDQPILNQLKFEAYQNLNRFTAVNDGTFMGHPQRSLQCPQDPGFGITCPGSQNIDFQGSLDPSSSSMALGHAAASSTVHPDVLMTFDNSSSATYHMDKISLPNFGNSFKVSELDPVHGKSQTIVTRGYIENDEEDENALSYHHHYNDMTTNWSPGTHEDVGTMYFTVSGTEETGMFDVHLTNVNLGSPRARWCKIKAAFKVKAAFKEVRRHTTARNPREGL
ncbi:CALMODULIN-BINDING PROTEIN60 [Arabidopsis suecica]|uniref:CALMODULIN-BINDING PROTEIN60 n=1 Tax=Arabidopsis suecica TaxID=45249 RepID=A0A8T1ZC34_ARASU|nr:CALMODULIN-BINDING PROTEIN60 [Arabidopsis suecica]